VNKRNSHQLKKDSLKVNEKLPKSGKGRRNKEKEKENLKNRTERWGKRPVGAGVQKN